jgi:hypothetical protein
MGEGLFGPTLAEEIDRHMVRNRGDWDVEYLFRVIGALSCSRYRLTIILEAAVHPLSRRGEWQEQCVAALNEVLRRDGYHLVAADQVSGHPVYRLRLIARGVSGAPKNLIFASIGLKPKIGFADAVNNDIVILETE